MIATVLRVEQEFTRNGDEYKKVTIQKEDGQETTKSVFNQLEDKWGLLECGATLNFQMEKKGQYWNVVDISKAERSAPPPETSQKPSQQRESSSSQKPISEYSPKAESQKDINIAFLNATTAASYLCAQGQFPPDDYPRVQEQIFKLNTGQLAHNQVKANLNAILNPKK
jgi:hypothetical protein